MEEALFKAGCRGGGHQIPRSNSRPKVLTKQNLQGDTTYLVLLHQGHLEFASKIASVHPSILYEPNVEGDTALHYALKIEQLDFFVEWIKSHRNYLEVNIQYIANTGYLVKKAMNCRHALRNKEGKRLAYMAAEKGYTKALRILMETPING